MFFDKLTKLNQRISYNLFAFNGYFIVFSILCSYVFGYYSGWNIFDFVGTRLNIFIIAIYFLTGIVRYMEHLTNYQLSFLFLNNKKFIKFLQLCTTITFIYLTFLFFYYCFTIFLIIYTKII